MLVSDTRLFFLSLWMASHLALAEHGTYTDSTTTENTTATTTQSPSSPAMGTVSRTLSGSREDCFARAGILDTSIIVKEAQYFYSTDDIEPPSPDNYLNRMVEHIDSDEATPPRYYANYGLDEWSLQRVENGGYLLRVEGYLPFEKFSFIFPTHESVPYDYSDACAAIIIRSDNYSGSYDTLETIVYFANPGYYQLLTSTGGYTEKLTGISIEGKMLASEKKKALSACAPKEVGIEKSIRVNGEFSEAFWSTIGPKSKTRLYIGPTDGEDDLAKLFKKVMMTYGYSASQFVEVTSLDDVDRDLASYTEYTAITLGHGSHGKFSIGDIPISSISRETGYPQKPKIIEFAEIIKKHNVPTWVGMHCCLMTQYPLTDRACPSLLDTVPPADTVAGIVGSDTFRAIGWNALITVYRPGLFGRAIGRDSYLGWRLPGRPQKWSNTFKPPPHNIAKGNFITVKFEKDALTYRGRPKFFTLETRGRKYAYASANGNHPIATGSASEVDLKYRTFILWLLDDPTVESKGEFLEHGSLVVFLNHYHQFLRPDSNGKLVGKPGTNAQSAIYRLGEQEKFRIYKNYGKPGDSITGETNVSITTADGKKHICNDSRNNRLVVRENCDRFHTTLGIRIQNFDSSAWYKQNKCSQRGQEQHPIVYGSP